MKTSLVGVSGLRVNFAVETVTSVLMVITVTSSTFKYEFVVAKGDFDELQRWTSVALQSLLFMLIDEVK